MLDAGGAILASPGDPRLEAAASSGTVMPSRHSLARIRRVRVIAAIAAALVSVVIAGPAFGLRLSSIINFGGSGSAPAPVQHDFSDFDLGAPADLSPGAIASQTRVITSTQLADGSHTLYVSPTQQGGYCYVWTGVGGTCDPLGTTPLALEWSGSRVGGGVASAYVSSVKITFADGTSAEPNITWISAPINAGFFLYEIPAGKAVAEIDGYNAGGTLVSSEHRGGGPAGSTSPPEFALTDQQSIALTVSTPDGPATAYTAPSTTGGTCAWFELDGSFSPLYEPGAGGCMPHGYTPVGFVAHVVRIGNSVLLAGAAGPNYTRFVLAFADGTTATVTPTAAGVILYALPASALHDPSARMTVTAYGSDGQVIFTHVMSESPASPPSPTASLIPQTSSASQ